jgi:CRISPR-associated protein Csm1
MTPQQQREYRTVILGALLHGLGGLGFLRAWGDGPARCVDPDLLEVLVQPEGRPSAPASVLVSQADALASGEAGPQRAAGTNLASVFQRVRLIGDAPLLPAYVVPAEFVDLRAEPPIFPRPTPPSSEQKAAHSQAFGQALTRLGQQLDWGNFECVYAHILGLLYRFATSIPKKGQEDVCLYDHQCLTSAVAACLYRHDRLALLVGDLSGIQDYLFDIATVGAGGVARRLRARSFFLQMVAEVAALKVLRALDLPLANVVMSSGGKFYVLFPQLPEVDTTVRALQRECDEWLLDASHGALALNLAWEPLEEAELKSGFSAPLKRLHQALAGQKQRRLEHALIEDNRWHEARFCRDPFPAGVSACRACNRFPAVRASEPGAENNVCTKCYQDVRLGRLLPSTGFVAFYDRPLASGTRCFDWTFFAAEDTGRLPPNPVLVARLNTTDLTPLMTLPAVPRLLANHVPCDPDGTPWTFTDIAAGRRLGEREAPKGLLAVLKADVDYLGQVFQEGLRRDQPPSYDTPARVTGLSRQLDLFFSGWLGWLLKTEFPLTYAVYSGGDDLLLVAPRAQALPLARRVCEAFAKYTCNSEITLSAGVAVVKPRLPLAHTVRFADENLESAKNAGRDRLCLLGQVVPWADLPDVEEAVGFLERTNPPSAFLYRLQQFGAMWRRWRECQDPRALRFQPLLAYTIGRNLKPGSELFTWASRLVGFPLDKERPEAKTMDYLGLITRWVLLGRREKPDDETA